MRQTDEFNQWFIEHNLVEDDGINKGKPTLTSICVRVSA